MGSRFSRTEEITERARDLRENISKTEAKLWPRLCKSRMGASFGRQHPVGPYFADYCCPSLKLVIEIDGPFHSREDDQRRDQFMIRRGFDVLRFSVEDMDLRFRNVIDTIHARVQIGLAEKQVSAKK